MKRNKIPLVVVVVDETNQKRSMRAPVISVICLVYTSSLSRQVKSCTAMTTFQWIHFSPKRKLELDYYPEQGLNLVAKTTREQPGQSTAPFEHILALQEREGTFLEYLGNRLICGLWRGMAPPPCHSSWGLSSVAQHSTGSAGGLVEASRCSITGRCRPSIFGKFIRKRCQDHFLLRRRSRLGVSSPDNNNNNLNFAHN